ncbi:DUF2887 domain-containing protein [Candidatus Thiodictyon syntrophicum]|jgi:predicted transposase YdaD|uniref:DUF4351 domain-containing protein n=1 Tax=Candidatus Thiodictyon syntrophicum TaxID=1166950 RepID=A0A2K8UDG9_9GAMM|nr:DUF2887 domain-containing protein [Candidatus Thiodictyon syntrophicum]AUB83565.1 hypothetical protein THSYN_23210 [Candidatus Thiodictyon syntrophicum]
MKTDPSIYEFLATGVEAFRVLSDGVTLSGSYRFVSLTIKGIERRLDGIYEPEDHDGPVYVVEFQAQPAPGVWYNLLTKLGLYGEAHPGRPLRGMLIFLLMERFPLLTDEELRTMFPVLVPLEQTRAYQDIFAKGKADGKAEGEAKGEAKGKADGLKRQLKRRFGVLPRWAILRLDAAAIDQLDGWLEGIFEAQSLEDLLGPRPRRGGPKVR